MASQIATKVPHLMTLADLSPAQIDRILVHAYSLKRTSLPWLSPQQRGTKPSKLRMPSQSLFNKTVALMFSKRSTRTRVSAETASVLLGGRALFLGREDIQLGVNESTRDTARVVGGMCQGIFARVGDHSEIEVRGSLACRILNTECFIQELAKHSPVPVLNALSSLWHPTQILADLMTLREHSHLFPASDADAPFTTPTSNNTVQQDTRSRFTVLPELRPLTVAYIGDSANVLHDMLVTYPRLGHKLRVASPEDAKYRAPKPVWDRVVELGCDKGIWWGQDPAEAVHGADIVVTDTWYAVVFDVKACTVDCFSFTDRISMGQEAEREERIKAFQGYQVTEELCKRGGAHQGWKFLHCLPRKKDEVDDEVCYAVPIILPNF
jgi:ornithine carbamoyltransferase